MILKSEKSSDSANSVVCFWPEKSELNLSIYLL